MISEDGSLERLANSLGGRANAKSLSCGGLVVRLGRGSEGKAILVRSPGGRRCQDAAFDAKLLGYNFSGILKAFALCSGPAARRTGAPAA